MQQWRLNYHFQYPYLDDLSLNTNMSVSELKKKGMEEEEEEMVFLPTGAVMASSTCHNQLCVQMGEVTLDNWETRPNQQFIICLPNRVSVELVVKE